MTLSTSTNTLVLIGWDDIKGRPIYSKKQQATSSAAPPPVKKKSKASIKKSNVTTRAAPAEERKRGKTKNQRGGNPKKNGHGRRNVPTVQVAVGSLLSSGTAYNDNVAFSFNDPQINQPNPTRRKVSFSPTSKSDNDIANSKPGFIPSAKSWDRKRKGYGSKKFSRGSSGYSSPVFVLDGAVVDTSVGWNRGTFTSTSIGSNDCDDMLSVESERLEHEQDVVLSMVDGDNDLLTSRQSKNNDDGADLSLSNRLLEKIHGDIQSDGQDSMSSSLDNHSEGSELGNDSNGSFSYGDLDKHDHFVQSCSVQLDDSIPEMIHVEVDAPDTNDDDDLTIKADEPSSTTTNSVGHDTSSTKTVEEETSYKLHSGGKNDFTDFDIHLDDPNSTGNKIHGKKRSYGCSEKPVWVSNKRQKASAVTTFDNVVSWDEGKCRPIFHAKTKKNVMDENALLDESNGDAACDDFASDDVNDANMKSHKRRQYSSRFRKTSLTKAIEKMSVLTSPKEADDHSDVVESLQEQEDCSRDVVILDNEKDEANNVKSNNLDLEMEDLFNDDNARHLQPTESSSLEAARAFFRYLDGYRLVVDQTNASPRVSSEVIRTTRSIVHSDQLRTEYSEYCDMLTQTGVAPITITEFASNWNRYFVGKGIRDGLFDED